MSGPAATFLSALHECQATPLAAGETPALTAELDAFITSAHAVAAAAWTPVALGMDAFARHLAACVAAAPGAQDGWATLTALHLTDLYMACAAGMGVPHARERFVRQFLQPIEGAVRTVGSGTNFVEDVRQQLHERLLLPAQGSPPKILQYGGRAALATWISIAARRAALELLRENEARQRLADDAFDDALGLQLDPELQYLKDRYTGAFKAAVSAAIAQLPPRDRMILRLHSVGGLTLARIATMLSVDESTVCRWEKRAREAIVNDTNVELGKNLGVSPTDLPSLVRLVSSQLDVSVARLLASDESNHSVRGHPPDRAE